MKNSLIEAAVKAISESTSVMGEITHDLNILDMGKHEVNYKKSLDSAVKAHQSGDLNGAVAHYKDAAAHLAKYKEAGGDHVGLEARHNPKTEETVLEVAADGSEHERLFWKHMKSAYKAYSVDGAQRHSRNALDHAKKHFEKTGKKIDAEGLLDGLPSGHEHYLKY